MDLFGYNLHNDSDCAELLELNDRFIRRYVEVMERYGMFPACGEVLYDEVKKEFPQRFIDYLDAVNSFTGFSRLTPPCNPEGLMPLGGGEWIYTDYQDLLPDEQSLPQDDQSNDDKQSNDGDQGKSDEQLLADDKVDGLTKIVVCFRRMFDALSRQMLDWSNIYAVGLGPNAREEGMQILFLVGHLLGLCKTAMFACQYCATRMSIQFVEQALKEISRLELLIDSLQKKMPQLGALFRGRRVCIEEIRKLFVTYKNFCEKFDFDLDGL